MLYQFFIDANDKDNKVSSRGLMILFAFGFIPLILGIDITKINISIPWLMDVSIKYRERFSLIYVAVLLYSVYRFRLSNREVQKYCNLRSLGLFLMNKTFGKAFIHKYIFNSNTRPSVYVDLSKQGEEIVVSCNYDYESPQEPPDHFLITMSEENQWVVQLKQSENKNTTQLGVSQSWGIEFDPYCYPFDGEHVVSDRNYVSDSFLKIKLSVCVFFFSFKAAAKEIICLDYYLPIYCNVGLSTFLVWNYLLNK